MTPTQIRANRRLMKAARWAAMTPEQRLLSIGSRLLRKADGYAPKEQHDDYEPVEAEAIGNNGNLRPTWQGRA